MRKDINAFNLFKVLNPECQIWCLNSYLDQWRMAEKDSFERVTQIVDSPVVVALVIVLKSEKTIDKIKVTKGGLKILRNFSTLEVHSGS